jgi:hypothetical protein
MSERAKARKEATLALGPIYQRRGSPETKRASGATMSKRAEARKDATLERGAAARHGAPSRSERAVQQ